MRGSSSPAGAAPIRCRARGPPAPPGRAGGAAHNPPRGSLPTNAARGAFSAVRGVLAIAILATALSLGLHLVPGFHNVTLADQIVVSADAPAFSLRLNFDKTATGILILGLCYVGRIHGAHVWREAWRAAWP